MAEISITVQTLKNDRHELKISLDSTVQQLKTLIGGLPIGIPANSMRVIHTGNILENDAQKLGEAGVSEENNLVVVMKLRKKKRRKAKKKAEAAAPAPTPTPAAETPPPPYAAAETKAPAPAAAAAATPAATPAAESSASSASSSASAPMDTTAETPAAPEAKAPEAASAEDANASSSAEAMVVGEELQGTIANLMALGDFSMQQVQAALRAAYNNPDRAAEYLFTGIPPNLAMMGGPPPQAAAPAAAPAPEAQGGNDEGGNAAEAPMGGGAPGGMDMRQMLTQNPEFLRAVLQNMSQTNPELVQQLAQNPAALMQMMQMMQAMGGRGGGGGGMPPGMGGPQGGGHGGPPPGVVTVELTEAERQSVQNLMALAPGISQQQALQAFLVCDRQEELAANYLLDQMFG